MENSTHVIIIGLILKYTQGLPNHEKKQTHGNRAENINTVYTPGNVYRQGTYDVWSSIFFSITLVKKRV